MLHVGNKTGRIYKAYRVPVRVIQNGTALQNYETPIISGDSSFKFVSYYNALLPSFGIDGNSELDDETHTFHNFGSEFEIVNRGKNLFDEVLRDGASFGFSGKQIYVVPVKAGKKYRISYGSKVSGKNAAWIYIGASKNGVKYTYENNLTNYLSGGSNFWQFIVSATSMKFPQTVTALRDCYLVFYGATSGTVSAKALTTAFTEVQIEEGTARTGYEPYREPQTINVNLSDFTFRQQYGGRSEEPSTINALRKVNENSFDILEIRADDTWMEWDEERQEPIYGFTRRGVFLHKNVSVINSYAGEDLEGFDWIAAETDAVTGLPVIGTTVYVGDYYDTAVYYDTESDAAMELLRLAQIYRTNVIVVWDTQDGVSPSGIHATYYTPN